TEHMKEAVIRSVELREPSAPGFQPLEKPTKKPGRESSRIDQFNEAVGGIHKAGHFALFASLCFLVYLSAALERQQSSYYFKVAFDILLFAAVTESLQHLTLDRTAGILDWRTDVYGLLTGLAVFLVIRFIPRIGTGKGRFGV
ncbi:MAG: VanZ family protein, partial [Verrucomicrobiota bacterium]|nr:VanZ family protein [Verrucomicrobiota bacterium]